MGHNTHKVCLEHLTAYCNPDDLGFETTAEVSPLEKTVGQERAVKSLEFGLNIETSGYNIYVAGLPGTGRTTTIRNHLERAAVSRKAPNDWCYVHNFRNPSHPIAISVPPGFGRKFFLAIEELISDCRHEIPLAFESVEYRQKVETSKQRIQEQMEALTQEIEDEARQKNFQIQSSSAGIITTLIKGGKPLSQEQYKNLPAEEQASLRKNRDQIQEFIRMKRLNLRKLEKEATSLLEEIVKETAFAVLGPIFEGLLAEYLPYPKVTNYLSSLRDDIVLNLGDFRITEGGEQQAQTREDALARQTEEEERFTRYRVNVLVDNSEADRAPVVFEYSPSYYNLFGSLEYRRHRGSVTTDSTMIRPGAIHAANGGYLVVHAKDLLANAHAWEAMKRTLRSGEARIENIGEQYSPMPTTTLNPEPIPIQTKIVMIGTPGLLQYLRKSEEDFRKLFKVRADFDLSMERTEENINFYASFICNQSHNNSEIRPFHKGAVAKVVDYSSRLVEHQKKLTTRFNEVVDLITEANYWATQDNCSNVVMRHHVNKAIKERTYRSNLFEEQLQDLIKDGTIIIDTAGEVVGQINGISVLDLGDHTFGRPIRITARTSLGRGQVAHIDRETHMTGRIHNKGFLILTGYLQGQYGQDRLLNFRSTIGFEQSYDEIEGDSASSAELYSLLSSLAGLPIKQGLAVTGSVNQRGEIQAIGGATYKIEGFFDVCQAKGLTGKQGVIIPKDNVKNLVLREDVIDAVREGKFTIYAVGTIDEGIELLTGTDAGKPSTDGSYPDGTVHGLIERHFGKLANKTGDLSTQDEAELKPWKERTSESGALE